MQKEGYFLFFVDRYQSSLTDHRGNWTEKVVAKKATVEKAAREAAAEKAEAEKVQAFVEIHGDAIEKKARSVVQSIMQKNTGSGSNSSTGGVRSNRSIAASSNAGRERETASAFGNVATDEYLVRFWSFW